MTHHVKGSDLRRALMAALLCGMCGAASAVDGGNRADAIGAQIFVHASGQAPVSVATDGVPAAPSKTFDDDAPPGAAHLPAQPPATPAAGSVERIKLYAAKDGAPAAAAQSDWDALKFSSGSYSPPPGLDPRIAQAATAPRASAAAGGFTYGFVLVDEILTKPVQDALTELGITLLGPHSQAHKARLPLSLGALNAAAALPYVRWISQSAPAQKLDSGLQQARMPLAGSAVRLPVVINLFEPDADGAFGARLAAAGAELGRYDPGLMSYRALVTDAQLDSVAAFDFVLFVEPELAQHGAHNQSIPLIGADYIRPGAITASRYNGAPIILGIMDSGFMMGGAAATPHDDLQRYGCGNNYTTDAADVWNDQNGHGTHVLGSILGGGVADIRYRGVAHGIGGSATTRVRAAKVFKSDNSGSMAWTESAMDYMAQATDCSSGRPLLINYSGGAAGTNLVGTDSTSRKLDDLTWNNRQLYVVAAGNSGSAAGTVGAPAVAKNALTVGNVWDTGYHVVGQLTNTSSRGPTGDGRIKPNVVAAGRWIMSAQAGTTSSYVDKSGTSMATPQVTGMVAALMEHYPFTQNNPALVRAWLMATALQPNDNTVPDSLYGFGRVSAYKAHWSMDNANGWLTHYQYGTVTDSGYMYRDVVVPAGARRLVVVMTWDEPAASAGALKAVTYDLDLWIDKDADCSGTNGRCGEYYSNGSIDNVEYRIIENPPAGTYRIKAAPYNAPASGLPAALVAVVIRGDTTPAMTLAAGSNVAVVPSVGNTFTITTTVSNPAYVASGVYLSPSALPSGVTLTNLTTTLKDGTVNNMGVPAAAELTMGDIVAGDARSATWTYRVDSAGAKTFTFRAWSENGGEPSTTLTIPTLPGAPTLTGLVPGDTSMQVLFTPPASNGGSPITSYTAKCTGGGSTKSQTGSGSPITVTGLTNGVSYSCTVRATNVAAGPESAPLVAKAGKPKTGLAAILMLLLGL